VRPLPGGSGRALVVKVEPHLPVDVIGCYMFLPA
jgi:hypothetical protein